MTSLHIVVACHCYDSVSVFIVRMTTLYTTFHVVIR